MCNLRHFFITEFLLAHSIFGLFFIHIFNDLNRKTNKAHLTDTSRQSGRLPRRLLECLLKSYSSATDGSCSCALLLIGLEFLEASFLVVFVLKFLWDYCEIYTSTYVHILILFIFLHCLLCFVGLSNWKKCVWICKK